MNNIRFTVITINYNNKEGLTKTIKSVTEQNYNQVEYIVVDGQSTDGSIDVINEYRSRITTTIIEKDSGIYDAMNKGIKASTGQYIIFMNSGDWFTSDDILSQLAIHTADQTDIIYGDLTFTDTKNNSTNISNYPSRLSFEYFTKRTLPHQAALIKRSLFEEIGLYDTSYKIVSDFGFFCLAICKYQKSYKKIPIVVANFPIDGIGSKQIKNRLQERKKFLDQHFKLFINDYNSYSKLKNALPIRIVNKLFRYY